MAHIKITYEGTYNPLRHLAYRKLIALQAGQLRRDAQDELAEFREEAAKPTGARMAVRYYGQGAMAAEVALRWLDKFDKAIAPAPGETLPDVVAEFWGQVLQELRSDLSSGSADPMVEVEKVAGAVARLKLLRLFEALLQSTEALHQWDDSGEPVPQPAPPKGRKAVKSA